MKRKGKLPSGSVRVQAYDYTDENGKKHYKSFTARTKTEAVAMRNEWKYRRDRQADPDNLTVLDAVKRYIDSKAPVLSPATLRGYDSIVRTHLTGRFGKLKINDMTSQRMQVWISDMAKDRSPKTVKNAYGLVSAALEMFAPDLRLKVQLPARKKPDLYCPSDEDIKVLLDTIKGDDELELAVLLAAFGPLRRGEICALADKDVTGNQIKVSKSIVEGPDKIWIEKQPKTYGSYRMVQMPDFVIERIRGKKGRLIESNPDQISRRFRHAVDRSGLPHFRFHDLRHYAASVMHAIGVPDQYILQRGGWSSDNVMKSVYRNVISLEEKKQTAKISQHFSRFSV